MPGPHRAGFDDPAGESLEDRPRPRDRGDVAADHHVERPLPGVLRRPAQRSVDQRDARGARAAARRRVEAGSEVEQSTTSSGLPADASPSGP